MIEKSIGLIETVGLSAAIAAADNAMKSANVTLIGYELTKGGGMVVIKIYGEVGAVNAAIAAASIAAAKVGQVFATKIIPRVAEGIDLILNSPETIAKEQLPNPIKMDTLQSIDVTVITEEKPSQPISESSALSAQNSASKPNQEKKVITKTSKTRNKLTSNKEKNK